MIFERTLIKNIKASQSTGLFTRVSRISGRVLIELASPITLLSNEANKITDALSGVYGIANFMLVKSVDFDLKTIIECVTNQASKLKFTSFAVRAKRSNKSFPLTSKEIEQAAGAQVLEALPNTHVNLTDPDITFYVEVVENRVFVGSKKHKGPGGLPVGVSGRVLVLLSGGIDSPVAASLLQKRGCPVDFIHFHNVPYTSEASIDKVRELARILGEYQKNTRLFLVPFSKIQSEIVKNTDQEFRVLLYRRFMMRIAQSVAEKNGILVLSTGDSIGQVASQTIENISAVDAAISMPILRPLAGLDKEEVIRIAKRIGTYNESILPYDDCCTYFKPKRPATHANFSELDAQEKKLNIDELVINAVINTQLAEIKELCYA